MSSPLVKCLHETSCSSIICFACYSLPTQSGNLRGPRVAGKTDDQSTCRGRNATCERRKILLLVPFLILVWHYEPINKFKLQAIICTPLQVNTKRISEEILVKCSEFLTLHCISAVNLLLGHRMRINPAGIRRRRPAEPRREERTPGRTRACT